MKAYVTSIGETTTDLCIWSLERNGFEVVLLKDNSPLVDKLQRIYAQADDDFVRIDADVVVNKWFTPDTIFLDRSTMRRHEKQIWWIQFQTFGWFKQAPIFGGVQYIKKQAIPTLLQKVDEFYGYDRPETELSRIEEFYNPRRFASENRIVGIHGFAQDDIDRVRAQKKKRNYYGDYDFELAEKLEGLLK